MPLRIARASGSASDTSRSVICSPRRRCSIWAATRSQRSASSSSPLAARSLAFRAAPAGAGSNLSGERPGLADRAGHGPAGLGVELEHLLFALAGAPRQGLGDRPHRFADLTRAIHDPGERAALAADHHRSPRMSADLPEPEAPWTARVGSEHA
ncbi:MAG: hypothetical protein LC790_15525 [Actinobacteria bacterium]|nr:hypothetical protein [Actinomycetota bacterium]